MSSVSLRIAASVTRIARRPMGRFVIVAYKPKPGKESDLAAAVEKHLRVLQAEGLVTEKSASVMRAADGTIVEVFEWRSADAIAKAYASPAVNALWGGVWR